MVSYNAGVAPDLSELVRMIDDSFFFSVVWRRGGYVSRPMASADTSFQIDPQDIARSFLGADDVVVDHVPGGGSNRDYFRISVAGDPVTWILCLYDGERAENKKFVGLTIELAKLDVRVPKVMHHDEQLCWYVMEDLGRTSLWDIAEDAVVNRGTVMEKYCDTLESVAQLHAVDEGSLPDGLDAMMEQVFDGELYRWEQGYFFEHFAGMHLGMSEAEVKAMANHPLFAEMADGLDAVHPRCLVHRDFQSQNVISGENGVALIDYQGVRLGLGEYDVASLLYDPYTTLAEGEIDALLDHYYRCVGAARGERQQIFYWCAVQRLMQALGAYGNLGHKLGKPRYLAFIDPAIDRLRTVTAGTPLGDVFAPVLRRFS